MLKELYPQELEVFHSVFSWLFFPFLLFILNLIAFIPIENFDGVLFNFIELLLPQESQSFFTDIFNDIRKKQRTGLLSSVFLLSIILTANGVSSIFSSFEGSYHVELSRSFIRQYLYSMMVGVLLALLLLVGVTALIFFEIFIFSNLDVKAVEYFIKKEFDKLDLGKYKEFIHFGLTSQDINNTAIPLSIKEALIKIYLPNLDEVLEALSVLSEECAKTPMLSRTHGQPASPTLLGKEIAVF